MPCILTARDLAVFDVRKVFEECFLWDDGSDPKFYHKNKSFFSTENWHGENSLYYSTKGREEHLVNFCQHLRESAQESDSHILAIDSALSSLFECQIIVAYCPGEYEDPEIAKDTIALRTYNILRRLPQCALDLRDLPSDLDAQYLLLQDPPCHAPGQSWETLKASNFLSIVIIQMTLSRVAMAGGEPNVCPNEFAEVLETVSHLAAQETSEVEINSWFIVRAAVWSCWQRAVTLCFYFDLCMSLKKGFSNFSAVQPYLSETTPTPNISIRKMSEMYAAQGKADSMCSWAFGLLRRDPISLGMDFRTYHNRYQQLWGTSTSRCSAGFGPCLGKDPDKCRRFKGLLVRDQSMHDTNCSPATCTKLSWDEASYRAGEGARAVCLDEGLAETCFTLRYCKTSQKTLAISHVWSHGQGGRPHEGINLCLHRRYVQICRDLGCSEYWWDSACIPEDHELRSEAISNINSVFENSKVTLVCDQDLMGIDISNITVMLQEAILATVLVCDWNLRAWTFLESFRGRHQIHLLCKKNKTINFRDLCIDICNSGSIDMAIFILTVGHMLPQQPIDALLAEITQESGADYNYLRPEIAGHFLSYRPASRKGDDIAIWSLLTGNVHFDSVEDMWISQSKLQIYTGFLVSSAPRSKTKGLSWLPQTPYFKSSTESSKDAHEPLRAFSGHDSMPGLFTGRGLKADWLVYEFDTSGLTVSERIAEIEFTGIIKRYLQGIRWGALLRPILNFRSFAADSDLSAKYEQYTEGTVIAVLGSCSATRPLQMQLEDGGWTWKGVYVWSKDVQLPKFQEVRDLFIE